MKRKTLGVLISVLFVGSLLGGALALSEGENSASVSTGPTVLVRVEGPASTIFQGEVTLSGTVDVVADNSGNVYTLDAATPLAALELASWQAGFHVQITDQYVFWDLFVESVAGVGPSGFSGWLYRVNAVMPYYGAGYGWQSYGPPLDDGDEILWYWGMSELPARIVQKDIAVAGPPIGFLVEAPVQDYFHIPGNPWPTVLWKPLPNATVHAGALTAIADSNGIAIVRFSSPGTYEVYAEASWFIRSTRLLVKVALGAEVRVTPQTINRRSEGQWVTIRIELPAGYDPLQLDRASLLLGGVSVAEISPQYGHVRNLPLSDNDGDGLQEILIKFDRGTLASLAPGTYPLVLTGTYSSSFEVYGESQPVTLL